MNIKKIAKEMTREEFKAHIFDCNIDDKSKCSCFNYKKEVIQCPHVIGLKEEPCKENENNCYKCWLNAIKDIRFKNEEGKDERTLGLEESKTKEDKYEKVYSIQEVFDFEEGTEFICNDIIFRLESNVYGYTENIVMLINTENDGQMPLTQNSVNFKFKLVKKDRKVPLQEAMEAYSKGKTIICKYKSALNDSMMSEEFKPIDIERGRYIWEADYIITPYMILNARWFIKGEN